MKILVFGFKSQTLKGELGVCLLLCFILFVLGNFPMLVL